MPCAASNVCQTESAERCVRPLALLKELEQRGLIRKEPVSYDARRKKIVVTEEALKYKDCVLRGLDELNRKLTAGISEEEMQVFFTVTDKMLKNLAE